MKKTLYLVLTLVIILSFTACGGNKSSDTSTPAGTDKASDQSDISEHAIGESFGTDSVECVITDVKWITAEDVSSHPSATTVKKSNGSGSYKQLMMSDLFPGYNFYGVSGLNSENTGYPYLCVTFTLKNIGKEIVEPTIKGFDIEPYGNISVLYGDGYTFDAEEGFNQTLEVLGNTVKEGRVFDLPDQVSNNTNESLKIKISLPTSSGEKDDFIVSVR